MYYCFKSQQPPSCILSLNHVQFLLIITNKIYLSEQTLLVTSFCVQNRQVFGLHRLNQQPETLFKVQFIQDSDLNRVWFRQVYWVELCL